MSQYKDKYKRTKSTPQCLCKVFPYLNFTKKLKLQLSWRVLNMVWEAVKDKIGGLQPPNTGSPLFQADQSTPAKPPTFRDMR